MNKKCKVVLLPTNKKVITKGQLYLSKDSSPMRLDISSRDFTSDENFNKIPQHLYFLSDEEIKELPK